MKTYRVYGYLIWLVIAASVSSVAQDAEPIRLGAFDLTPTLDIQVAKDDNVYQTAVDQVSTTVTTTTPALALVFDNGISGFSLDYAMEHGDFASRSSENYMDQRLSSSFGSYLGQIHLLELSAALVRGHDRRGPDSPSGGPEDIDSINTDLDEFDDDTYSLSYTLGSEAAPLRLRLTASELRRRYTTNLATTELVNRDETSASVHVFSNITPSLSLGISYRGSDVDYVVSSDSNSEERTPALDLAYNPNNRFQLRASVGTSTRKVLLTGDESDNDFWDISLDWSMLSYSTLSLVALNNLERSNSVGGATTSTEQYSLTWNHEWTDSISTAFTYSLKTDEFLGVDRTDDDELYQVNVSYQFRRWATMSIFSDVFSRESGRSAIGDYEQTIYGLNLRLTL